MAHPSVVRPRGEWRPVYAVSTPRGGVPKKPKDIPAETVERVWEAFLRITGKKFTLNERRRKACKSLARVHSFAAIEQAFRGLSESAWHRGENEQGVEYIEPHLVDRNFQMFFQLGGRDE